MTTPENFRRRQLREGIALIVLGLFTVLYAVYDSHQSDLRDQCMAQSFADLGDSLEIRSDLTIRTDKLALRAEDLQDAQIENNTRVVEDVSAATSSAEVAAAFVRYKRTDDRLDAQSLQLDKRVAKLTAKRVKTVIPPFPTGKCGTEVEEKKQ